MKDRFFEVFEKNAYTVESLGINSFDKCDQLKCADLQVEDYNLVPLLEKSNIVKFDTFLALDGLEFNDFRYKGYVELEVKLDLGI